MPKSEKSIVQSGDMQNYLRTRIGETIFLNADSRKPFCLHEVKDDYFELTAPSGERDSGNTLIVPITSVVSVQEMENQIGLVVYLIK